MLLTHHGIDSLKNEFGQEWIEDENVTTSLGHRIPVDSCGVEIGLHSMKEMPFMHTVYDACGVEISFQGVRTLPYMHTVSDSCGIGMGLVSIEEIQQ